MGKEVTRKHVLDALQNLGTATAKEIVDDIQRNYRRGIPTVKGTSMILREMSYEKKITTEYNKNYKATVYTYLGE